MVLNNLYNLAKNFQKRARRMPVLFIGHGHPINAVLDNDFTKMLSQIGKEMEKPEAILVISAHWETVGTYISSNQNPRTIYDFGRFNDDLYNVSYNAPGSPELANDIMENIKLTTVQEDENMGFDHGAWTILKFLWPQADVPVLQMSLDYGQNAAYHFELAKQLAYLRQKGVLVVCSGNIVHNLARTNWGNMDANPYDWNIEFDEMVKTHLDHQNFGALVNYEKFGEIAKLAIPTNEHYLPMIYSLGMVEKNESITHLFEGYQFGSMSMRCFKIG
ncbi:4,5-DOPA dioxygenase extradiol [Pedobacter mucosus]|uniref:4,5-DOPA-extradiol-dioxygenase n=1 Tax=Pedobacter mucosus TaxID=2895286 RepID=UPI001EE3AFBF|nr:4,5-DOPA dioxygenase extradiol [Pedobacter mucosus]UKT65996.1 4,5-DOPA dioxygenase extradiol [Pedobacter mucosus]